MMCQATGYKLTSNKELPSNYQHFSMVIPETTSGETSADNNQKHPMITITKLSGSTYTIELARIQNILSASKTFTQQAYGTSNPLLSYGYIPANSDSRYISWTIAHNATTGTETERTLITV